LDKENLENMIKDPSLRSNNIISAIFYNSVILVEGESDRKVYSAINEMLYDIDDKDKIENVYYLHSDGNGNFRKFITPIAQCGIPIAIVSDLDIICEGDRLKSIFDSLGIGNIWENYRGQKDFAYKCFQKKSGSTKEGEIITYIHGGGVNLLEESESVEVRKFLDSLKEKGIFLVEVGTLESWLSKYKIKIDFNNEKSKKQWLNDLFNLLNEGTIKIEDDDIWKFIREINTYLKKQIESEMNRL
jgi:hypothetical protein